MNPQLEVEYALLRNERLTNMLIQAMCRPHTMDGRRIISRLEKKFNIIKQHIHREKLIGLDGKRDKFCTYWLERGY